MAGTLPDALLADRASELIPFGEGGTGVMGGMGRRRTTGTTKTIASQVRKI